MIEHANKAEKIFKLKFKNKLLLLNALTHKSANQIENNEKLEFLGDRVLGLVLSKKLFDLYPKENEGILDKKFANLVKKKTCSEIAWSLGLQNFIITGNTQKKVTKFDEKILSDCCEALIGAIYIDQGLDFVENFILKSWKNKIDKSSITILDPKTKLQEFSLKKYKKLPIYKSFKQSRPNHNPIFKVQVQILNSKKFFGYGKSKKIAETSAASKLIKSLNIN